MEWKHLEETLERYGEYLANRMKQNLQKEGSNVTGELSNSIEYIIDHNGSTYSVSISLLDYWKYVNSDTKPHFPPVKAIEDWITAKKIMPQVSRNLPSDEGKLPTVPQLAFLIARSISEYGTKGNHFMDDADKDANDRFMLAIELSLEEDLNEEIDLLFIEL